MGAVPAEVMNTLSDRRTQSEVLRSRRVAKTYEQYPELKETDDQLRYFTAERMLFVLENRDENEAIRHIEDLKKKKSAFLSLNKIPENYDQVIPFCPSCSDEGFVDGKECACLRELLLPVYFDDSGISRYPGVSFSDFSEDFYSDPDKIRPIRQFSDVYVDMDRNKRPNLLFWGNPGTGKTFMAISIARAILMRAEPVLVIRSSELIETMDESRTLKRSFNPDPIRESEVGAKREKILETDLLVIDELGVEAKGPYNAADLLFILGERHQKGKATIITTNLSLAELGKHYDQRLHSRMIGDFTIFHFEGEDIRTKDIYRKSDRGGRIS